MEKDVFAKIELYAVKIVGSALFLVVLFVVARYEVIICWRGKACEKLLGGLPSSKMVNEAVPLPFPLTHELTRRVLLLPMRDLDMTRTKKQRLPE